MITGTFLHANGDACNNVPVITICVKTVLFRYYVVPKQNASLLPFENTEERGYVESWYIVRIDYLLITAVINYDRFFRIMY